MAMTHGASVQNNPEAAHIVSGRAYVSTLLKRAKVTFSIAATELGDGRRLQSTERGRHGEYRHGRV